MRPNYIRMKEHTLQGLPVLNRFQNTLFYLPTTENFNVSLYELKSSIVEEDLSIRDLSVFLESASYRYDGKFHYLNMTPGESFRKLTADYDVEYKLNSSLFRCDEFTDKHKGKHILFAGCSETFGEGGNVEDSWSHRLYTKLSETNDLSGYFNLGVPGSSWDDIIMNVNAYINKYGRPDILCILAPNVVRYLQFITDIEVYRRTQMYQPLRENKEYRDIYFSMFPIWLVSLKNFINYCNSIGTKVIWSTWSTQENLNILDVNWFRDSFLPTWDIGLDEVIVNDGYEIKEQDIFRRDGHHGNFYHRYIANEFLTYLVRDGYVKPTSPFERIPVRSYV